MLALSKVPIIITSPDVLTMKNLSLQEQLLKTGLISDAQVKQARTEKRRQIRKQRGNKEESAAVEKQLQLEKKNKRIERDRELNRQRNKEAQKQQIASQVKQLIELNKLPVAADDGAIAYHFTHGNKVKTIYLDEQRRDQVIAGQLAIVRLDQRYEIVKNDVAEKIIQRDPDSVVIMFSVAAEADKDDDYSDFQVPDDLVW